MSDFRFKAGDAILCNLGESGWKLGKVIALNYREDHWPAGKTAPYQVLLETDHILIYVPVDDANYCRKPTPQDLRINLRKDALDSLPPDSKASKQNISDTSSDSQLNCIGTSALPGNASYRQGQCFCCNDCPQSWSYAELYSEHYRCAARNGLKVTRHTVDLGIFRVGELLNSPTGEVLPCKKGFMQCPTLVRLPPGIKFSDDGKLEGEIQFDPHRETTYKVEFVAVSTVNWNDYDVGIVRLEINFLVDNNLPPQEFDVYVFKQEQLEASALARQRLNELNDIWDQWEFGELDIRETCDRMLNGLHQLRELLELHPRLDGGQWWVQLGGFHMNVHKLLENTLFECELYLGHALTFEDARIRHMAEQNLEGCYNKRLLETARFMWVDGIKLMMNGEWKEAANTLSLAADKKDGWGWAVNYGEIWISEANARLIYGAGLSADAGAQFISQAERLLELALERVEETGAFGPVGHPWAAEIEEALSSYRNLQENRHDITNWLKTLKLRSNYWCAMVLSGAPPFPPQLRPRLEDAADLISRLPGHNECINQI